MICSLLDRFNKARSVYLLFAILIFSSVKCEKSSYIVHLKHPIDQKTVDEQRLYHASLLKSASDEAEVLYSYRSVINGFSVALSEEEAELLEEREGVLAVVPDVKYELQTTRTPKFLGLQWSTGLIPESNSASDVVIGVLDTGIWPESRSLIDTDMGPVPDWWTGGCQQGKNFSSTSCNRKLIGAKFFCKGYEASIGPMDESKEPRSPVDIDGHGTHTATTAAGAQVAGASLIGYAPGTARGMATRAKIACYKVCWTGGCFSTDILAGIDAAVADGVNVLSLSLGGGTTDFYRDNLAIGAFAAMRRGIFVACSAGNTGPGASSLSNLAPWITTVGAGTIDRDFPATVTLDDGKKFHGVSLYNGSGPDRRKIPLVYAGNASNSPTGNLCMPNTLDPASVKGKIVFCDRGGNPRVQKGEVVKFAGGVGMVLANTAANGEELVADAHVLPAVAVGVSGGDKLRSRLLSNPKQTASLNFMGTRVGVQPSPVVAAFSSRGPSSVAPSILKPDMIAPGVNILAGWSGAVAPTGLASDDRRVEFNIISGTSMSCPHVSGLAALLKGAHPDWSPAAVRSALMTTAYVTDPLGHGKLLDAATRKLATPFDYGAGHVSPQKALDPGLIYDIAVEDYIDFLCASGYTDSQLGLVTHMKVTCDRRRKYTAGDLNYPSFAIPLAAATGSGPRTVTVTYKRTVTNVGPPGIYKVLLSPFSPSANVKVHVQPAQLSFSELNERKTYTVTFTADAMPSGTSSFSRLVWVKGRTLVGSPIAVTWT